MVISNIKKQAKNRGFTIVELLIVIVVIGILAAIVIVAYTGITARANLQRSNTNAAAMRDVAEAWAADSTTNAYPAISANFTTGTTTVKLPAGITPGKGGGVSATTYVGIALAVAATTTTTTILTPSFLLTGSATSPTGGVVIYWDPTLSTPALATTYFYYGVASATSTFIAPAS